jgi:hypothetical protein
MDQKTFQKWRFVHNRVKEKLKIRQVPINIGNYRIEK